MVRGRSFSKSEIRPIDRHVGRRLRARRHELGLSQVRLAEALGLTFQQVQKYEHGTNRVVASRLYDLAGVLRVPVDYFFAGAPREALEDCAEPPGENGRRPSDREILDLVSAYYAIRDDGLRRKLIDLVKCVARSDS